MAVARMLERMLSGSASGTTHGDRRSTAADSTDGETSRSVGPGPPLLEVRGLTKIFGPLRANDDVELHRARRRGPRPARGERGRQVHARQDALRRLPARRRARSSVEGHRGHAVASPARRPGPRPRHGLPGPAPGPRPHRLGERRPAPAGRPDGSSGPGRSSSRSPRPPSATGWRSTPRPRSPTSRSASGSGSSC